jgi:hypothetical protein
VSTFWQLTVSWTAIPLEPRAPNYQIFLAREIYQDLANIRIALPEFTIFMESIPHHRVEEPGLFTDTHQPLSS